MAGVKQLWVSRTFWENLQACMENNDDVSDTPISGWVKVEVKRTTPSIVEDIERGEYCINLRVNDIRDIVVACVKEGHKIPAIRFVRNAFSKPYGDSMLGLVEAKTLVEWWAENPTA